MNKVAIYARYSSDLQSEASIDDQIRICKAYAEKNEWTVYNCYSDHAMSGASMRRPGVQKLLKDVQADKIDIVLSESLDRLSRDQEDIAAIFKRIRFAAAKLCTISEGEITSLHIGMNGTMNALYLEDLARKTHRGQEGRARNGKCAGGNCYGYSVGRRLDSNGERIRGERVINPSEAVVVQRIFQEYADGKSPQRIAEDLNKDGIKAPRGGAWGPSTIYGNRKRANGIINNETYIGRYHWNRQRFMKNPDTGTRAPRFNSVEDWVITDVPDLRIIDQKLWDKVKSIQGKYTPNKQKNVTECHRPKYLLSYLIKCGECGGGMSIISKTSVGCSSARKKGTCTNKLTMNREKLETLVLSALSEQLMDIQLFEEFCEEYSKHMEELHHQQNTHLDAHKQELKNLDIARNRLVESIKEGIPAELVRDEVISIEERRKIIEVALTDAKPNPEIFLPDMAKRYHTVVCGLTNSLKDEENRSEAVELIRELIEKIVLRPQETEEELAIDLCGDLAGILSTATNKGKPQIIRDLPEFLLNEKSQQDKMVAGARNNRSPAFNFSA